MLYFLKEAFEVAFGIAFYVWIYFLIRNAYRKHKAYRAAHPKPKPTPKPRPQPRPARTVTYSNHENVQTRTSNDNSQQRVVRQQTIKLPKKPHYVSNTILFDPLGLLYSSHKDKKNMKKFYKKMSK